MTMHNAKFKVLTHIFHISIIIHVHIQTILISSKFIKLGRFRYSTLLKGYITILHILKLAKKVLLENNYSEINQIHFKTDNIY